MPKEFISVNVHSHRLMSSAEAAYLAGFFDGEGTISIIKARRPENVAGFRYQALMSISNTNQAVLEQIRDFCGNGRLVRSYNTRHPNHKPGYLLRFTANQVRHLLPQLVPFLRIKRAQAESVLEFLALQTPGVNRQPYSWWAKVEELRTRVLNLNRRGRAAEVLPAELQVREALPKHPKRESASSTWAQGAVDEQWQTSAAASGAGELP